MCLIFFRFFNFLYFQLVPPKKENRKKKRKKKITASLKPWPNSTLTLCAFPPHANHRGWGASQLQFM